jgi:hypothetical protein
LLQAIFQKTKTLLGARCGDLAGEILDVEAMLLLQP